MMNIYIFMFFFAVRKSLAAEENFTTCNVTRNCGRLNIEFPFFIQEQQETRCGYPGFNVSCRNNTNTIFSLPDGDYIIHDIFYQNLSFHVSRAVPYDADDVCSNSIRNVSVPSDWLYFPHDQKKVIFFFNCITATKFPTALANKVVCTAEYSNNATLALLSDDPSLDYASKYCHTTVGVPVAFPYEGRGVQDSLNGGFVLKWIARDCSSCEASGGKCGIDDDGAFRCSAGNDSTGIVTSTVTSGGTTVTATTTATTTVTSVPAGNGLAPTVAPTVLAGNGLAPTVPAVPAGNSTGFDIKVAAASSTAGIVVLIILVVCFIKTFSFKDRRFIWQMKTEGDKKIEAFLKSHEFLAPKRYRYSDVKNMTNSFRDKLGKGGFGEVYKGKLLDGRLVAVKILNKSKSNGEEFMNEVASISRTSHVNIVSLLGFCFEGRRRALIYEFVPNGSLEKFIFPDRADHQLNWKTLYQIAVGIARGLEYLHRGCNTRILHFDIKPHNILLDHEFCPKISDFGLAKLCLEKESAISMTGMRGTPGYVAPEVFSRDFGRASHKSDVYSYGRMILVMVGERKNINVEVDCTSEFYFPDWIHSHIELDEELGLQGIMDQDDQERVRKMIIVSLWCIQFMPSKRPSMSRVVEMLEGSIDSLSIPPKLFSSSPSRSPTANSSRISIS